MNLRRLVVSFKIVVETRGVRPSWDKSAGYLATGQAAAGVEEA